MLVQHINNKIFKVMKTVLIDTNNSFFYNTADMQAGSRGGSEDKDKRPTLKPTGIIDVVNNFSWYAGPRATAKGLSEVPRMLLVEREQTLSSLVQGAKYYVNNAANGVGELAKSVGGGKFVDDALNTIKGAAGNVLDRLSNIDDENGEKDRLLLAANNLTSLEGIYLTKPTGFRYSFPKYNFDIQGGNGGTWGTESDTPIIGELIEAGIEVVDNISKVANFASPGVYIEKPKYFQTADTGETQSVEFPLINTIQRGTESPIQQNYELLWLLAFHNRPYKTSFARTPPPKLYSVTCPGQFSMPYAYLSGMSVQFQGTVRNRTVTVPSGNGSAVSTTQVSVPVPEAYIVKLSFTSLLANYGNTMISEAQNVTIGSSAASIGTFSNVTPADRDAELAKADRALEGLREQFGR